MEAPHQVNPGELWQPWRYRNSGNPGELYNWASRQLYEALEDPREVIQDSCTMVRSPGGFATNKTGKSLVDGMSLGPDAKSRRRRTSLAQTSMSKLDGKVYRRTTKV